MSIVEKIAGWRAVALEQNTALDRISLWPHEYRRLVYECTGELGPVVDDKPGLKGVIFGDINLYVRGPLELRVFNDAGQFMRDSA